MQRYAVGIDPGLTETGVVLCLDDEKLTPIAWATFTSPTGHTDLARVVTLAGEIVNLLTAWTHQYEVRHLDIGIELPVHTRNVASFAKQVRLVQEVESGVFHTLAGDLIECWVTEVNPIQSKILATGSGEADKAMMIEASPFRHEDTRKATKEALADAWAHANATWGIQRNAPRTNFAKINAAPVGYQYNGSTDNGV